MKILITGVSGFFGGHLVQTLVARGHHVIGLKRRKSNISRLPLSNGENLVLLDVEDGFHEVLLNRKDVDLIVHAATAYGHNQETSSEIIEANIVFPLKLLEISGRNKNCGFINLDTFFSKGSDNYTYLSEYVSSKKYFLRIASNFASTNHSILCNMQIEHMYGVQDGTNKFTTMLVNDLLSNKPEIALTLGQQSRDFIYVDDVVSALICVIDSIGVKLLEGVRNFEIGSGVSTTIAEFATLARQIVGASSLLQFGALPYRKNELFHSRADLTAIGELGWAPKVKLDEGIGSLVSFMRSRTLSGQAHS
jgi:CDP-paratose synthetase